MENAAALKSRIDSGYVLVKFTETRGGTELGIRLEKGGAVIEGADFEKATGKVSLAGKLTLDYVPVICHAEIDLSTMSGEGYLEKQPQASEAASA
jgi:hypothetical protein